MKVSLQIKLEWDKSKETLVEFREKYDAFKLHVDKMQAMGLLPRNDVTWVISATKKPVALIDGGGGKLITMPRENRFAGRVM